MHFTADGLTLWYATDDAAAPGEDVVQPRGGVVVMVGVRPHHPANVVTVYYRIDDGIVQSVRGTLVRVDRCTAYYRCVFPTFWSGERVRYQPTLSRAGRTLAPRGTGDRFPSSFRLAEPLPDCLKPADPSLGGFPSQATVPGPARFPFSLEYLATLRGVLRAPEVVGETPEGIRVNWFWDPAEAAVAGPRLNGNLRRMGGDWMTIRRDGVALIDVRATLETDEGALVSVAYAGSVDLGPNGYRDFLDRRLPPRATTHTTPVFRTAHPAYAWLNRLHCTAVGEVITTGQSLAFAHDVYAVR